MIKIPFCIVLINTSYISKREFKKKNRKRKFRRSKNRKIVKLNNKKKIVI